MTVFLSFLVALFVPAIGVGLVIQAFKVASRG